jgi:two-component system, cell cycle sensor histidine kinase and response regulator CckA
MSKSLNVLVVEDSRDDAELLLYRLRQAGYNLRGQQVETEEEYRAHLNPSLDLIFCDYTLPQFDALAALDLLQETGLDIPFLIVSGTIGEEIAVTAMRKGAADYLLKDRLGRLESAVATALEQRQLRHEQQQRQRELAAIGRVSAALRDAQTCAQMIPMILDQLAALLNANGAMLSLHDPAAGELVVELGRGEWAESTGLRVPIGEGVSGAVFQSGRLYQTDDLRREPCLLHGNVLGRVKTAVCVPLIAQEEIIGVLWVGRNTAIGASEVRLVTAVADIAGSAIRRVTLHEQAEIQARQMHRIMETVPDGLILLDRELCPQMVNPAAATHLAILNPEGNWAAFAGDHLGLHDSLPQRESLTQLAGRPMAAFLAPPPSGALYHELSLAHPRRYTFELLAQSIGTGDDVQGWLLTIRDVSEERQLQQRSQQQERLAAVGQLAAGIAHDFNNILAVIVLYTQMMQRSTGMADKDKQRLETVYQQAVHATNLIQQILDFSRRSVIARSRVDLLPFFKEMLRLWKRTLPENIAVELTCEDNHYFLEADVTRLQQALMNLVLNARDAMPSGGLLRIHLNKLEVTAEMVPLVPDMSPGPWLCLTVSDTGAGIRHENMPYLFEPFFTTKEPGKGTGLGLAQVYGIVRQHNGHITLESRTAWHSGEPSGTTFYIYLPLLSECAPTDKVSAELPAPAGRSATILLVEDETATREAVREVLQSLGYRVLTAVNGSQALELFEQEPEGIDLVLSDLVMPDVGGIVLFQELNIRMPNLKMMIMTGYPLEDRGKALLEQGIVDWLQKPFSAEQIARKIHAALEE